jgi:hypothetical protein
MISLELFDLLITFMMYASVLLLMFVAVTATYWRGR